MILFLISCPILVCWCYLSSIEENNILKNMPVLCCRCKDRNSELWARILCRELGCTGSIAKFKSEIHKLLSSSILKLKIKNVSTSRNLILNLLHFV